MIEFINRLTGGTMWVAEERKEEYLAAGHKLAAEALKSAKTTKTPVKKKGAVKK